MVGPHKRVDHDAVLFTWLWSLTAGKREPSLTQRQKEKTMSNKQPIHRMRIGAVGVAIFENKTDDNQTFYNTQFDRSYRSGDEWKHTRSFGKDDLLVVCNLADLAHTWIKDKIQSASQQTEEAT